MNEKNTYKNCPILFSSSRDSSIKQWPLNFYNNNELNMPQYSYESHTNWINKFVYCQEDNRIISCSHDCSIKTWKIDFEHNISDTQIVSCRSTLNYHKDIILTISWDENHKRIVTGGLDNCVNI